MSFTGSILNPGNEQPDRGILEVAQQVDALKKQDAAMAMKPVSRPAPVKTSPVDKVNPKGKYGTKPGEKRYDVSGMTKDLPSYKKGTDFVPKTGLAVLHKGEKVTTAKDNTMAKESVFSKITEGDQKPPKKIKSIHTRKAAGGTYIHEHHHHYPEHHKMEEHTSADDKAMLQHLTDHAPEMSETAPAPAGPQGADQQMAGAVGAQPPVA